MTLFAKVLFRTGSLLLALMAVQSAIFASVDDAQSFALQAAEPYVKQGFQVREDYWGGDLGSEKKKQCGSNCLKETNIGFGWERKLIGQEFPFMFMIRMENWRKNQTDGRKGTSQVRT